MVIMVGLAFYYKVVMFSSRFCEVPIYKKKKVKCNETKI